jgi:hypothetical protein
MFEIKVYKNVLDLDFINLLIKDFQENANEKLPGRKFHTDLNFAKKILIPILKILLPENWIIDGGNYFETVRPYRLHVDTGKEQIKNLYYNIVIPLQLWTNNYDPNLNKLIITNQTWNDDAAFFVKGDISQNEYNKCVTDYSKVKNLTDSYDSNLLSLCPHLNPENLYGFTIKSMIEWQPGDIIFFPRNHIHLTSDWRLAGVYKKLGLSLFTSYKHPGSVLSSF